MRLAQTPASLLSLLLVALSNIESTQAWPIGELDFSFLTGRQACVSFCGADSQFCCTQGQSCTTLSGNIATCVAGGNNVAAATAAEGVPVYTTTWTETGLVAHTSTAFSYPETPTQAPGGSAPLCKTNLGETSCGTVCCPSHQTCGETPGTCVTRTTWAYNAPSDYSAPGRKTSGGVVTATASITPTTTQSFLPPATASGSNLPVISEEHKKGLSGGAIAGIVIGTIAGVILLLLVCFCCILKTGFDGLLAIFGLGKKRHRDDRVEITEERYSRHSGAGSRRQTHSGWFGGGGRPSKVSDSRKEKKPFGGLGFLGAGLLGLAVILGLKKKHDHDKEKRPRSDISSSYYSYDSYTGSSPSSASSDRRTRDTRRSHSRR